MPFDYTDLSACNTRVLARTQIRDTDGSIATEIGYKLEESAGEANSTTYYRPFYVGAVMLMQSRGDQTVAMADGAEFFGKGQRFNLQPTIESMLREQAALDVSLGLTIPDGYDTDTLLNALCGCQDEGQSSSGTVMAIMTS